MLRVNKTFNLICLLKIFVLALLYKIYIVQTIINIVDRNNIGGAMEKSGSEGYFYVDGMDG
jgi:hypothetical protein